MTETYTDAPDLLEIELAKIPSDAGKAAFKFFYEATEKEGFGVNPSYTWDQFHEGIAPAINMPLEQIDKKAEKLITNYNLESCEKNGLRDTVPMLDALKGPFVQAVHRQRQRGSVRIIMNHPTLATPYTFARSLIEAYQSQYEIDIRPKIFIVQGAYASVFNYIVKHNDGSEDELSPVIFGRSLGNLLLTAPRTESTKTTDHAVNSWMTATRATFKRNNNDILLPVYPDEETEQSEGGNIEIVIPSGTRAVKSFKGSPPFKHKEHTPDSSFDYITEFPSVPTFLVGVDDNLLIDPKDPRSVVTIVGDPRPRYLTTRKAVVNAISRCCELASDETNIYELDKIWDRIVSLGSKAIGHAGPVYE